MMASSKRFREIKIEVEKVSVISNLKKLKRNCGGCEKQSDFITLASAVKISKTTEKAIAQLAKENLIHFKLNAQNEILICLPSLLIAKDLF